MERMLLASSTTKKTAETSKLMPFKSELTFTVERQLKLQLTTLFYSGNGNKLKRLTFSIPTDQKKPFKCFNIVFFSKKCNFLVSL